MTPEEALKFLGFLALVEELDEEEEEWYEYYVTGAGGYFRSDFYDDEYWVYYSQSPNAEDEAISEFMSDTDRPPELYGWVYTKEGKYLDTITEEGLSVDVRKVPADEVDESNIL